MSSLEVVSCLLADNNLLVMGHVSSSWRSAVSGRALYTRSTCLDQRSTHPVSRPLRPEPLRRPSLWQQWGGVGGWGGVREVGETCQREREREREREADASYYMQGQPVCSVVHVLTSYRSLEFHWLDIVPVTVQHITWLLVLCENLSCVKI